MSAIETSKNDVFKTALSSVWPGLPGKNLAAFELRSAIERLGYELTPKENELVDEIHRVGARHYEIERVATAIERALSQEMEDSKPSLIDMTAIGRAAIDAMPDVAQLQNQRDELVEFLTDLHAAGVITCDPQKGFSFLAEQNEG